MNDFNHGSLTQVQTVNALQKLIRDEETNKAKEEERLEKLSKRPGSIHMEGFWHT